MDDFVFYCAKWLLQCPSYFIVSLNTAFQSCNTCLCIKALAWELQNTLCFKLPLCLFLFVITKSLCTCLKNLHPRDPHTCLGWSMAFIHFVLLVWSSMWVYSLTSFTFHLGFIPVFSYWDHSLLMMIHCLQMFHSFLIYLPIQNILYTSRCGN